MIETLLLKTLALAAILLPLGNLQAAGSTGFKVGQTFKLKVVKVTSTKKVGYFGTEAASPIPGNVPKFTKNKMIEFTIAKGGKLTAKGLSIPFVHASKKVVEYNLFKDAAIDITHNATFQRSGTTATGGELSFFINDYSGAEPVFQTVVYKLD
jgi:hypothetical protein